MRAILTLLLALLAWPAFGQPLVPATQITVPITTSASGVVQLVAAVPGRIIYVTNWNLIAGGTTNVTWFTGTGVNCTTGFTALTGSYQLTAQVGLVVGVGNGAVLAVPIGQALCIGSTLAVNVGGSLSYALF
jgi:hypothetical protein